MSRSMPRLDRRVAILALVLACALPQSGCYTYHVYQVGGPDGRELGNQAGTEWQRKTLHAFAWGAVRQDLPIEDSQRKGIEEIKVDTNIGYVAISAVTLGLWVPLDVSWRLAKPPVPTGTLE